MTIDIYSGCFHWTWWFSLAMLVITRGYPDDLPGSLPPGWWENLQPQPRYHHPLKTLMKVCSGYHDLLWTIAITMFCILPFLSWPKQTLKHHQVPYHDVFLDDIDAPGASSNQCFFDEGWRIIVSKVGRFLVPVPKKNIQRMVGELKCHIPQPNP